MGFSNPVLIFVGFCNPVLIFVDRNYFEVFMPLKISFERKNKGEKEKIRWKGKLKREGGEGRKGTQGATPVPTPVLSVGVICSFTEIQAHAG